MTIATTNPFAAATLRLLRKWLAEKLAAGLATSGAALAGVTVVQRNTADGVELHP